MKSLHALFPRRTGLTATEKRAIVRLKIRSPQDIEFRLNRRVRHNIAGFEWRYVGEHDWKVVSYWDVQYWANDMRLEEFRWDWIQP